MNDDLNGNPKPFCLPPRLVTEAEPFAKKIQVELNRWYQLFKTDLETQGNPSVGFFVSVTADFSRLTWHTLGDTAQFSKQLIKYINKNPDFAQGLDDLDQLLEAHQPSYLGSWITALKEDYEMGWYFQPINGQLKYSLPFLTRNSDLERIIEWSMKYSITQCDRLGRALVGKEEISELFLKINADTASQAIDIGLDVFRYLNIACPNEAVLSILSRHKVPELHVSLWVTKEKIIKTGLMLPQISAESSSALCNTVGIDNNQSLTTFEDCLGVAFPTYLEYQQFLEKTGVELHYTIG